MTTIVNNPPVSNESNNTVGLIIGLIILLIAAYIAFVYGIPALQRMQVGTAQIHIPSKIDINVNQQK